MQDYPHDHHTRLKLFKLTRTLVNEKKKVERTPKTSRKSKRELQLLTLSWHHNLKKVYSTRSFACYKVQ